ncbi:MAG: glutamine synthetase family protein [Pseudomonadota bacterium]
MDEWLKRNPQIRSLRVVAPDLNGQARGKRIPVHLAEKTWTDGARMPLSALNVDIWGNDIEQSPLVFESGDKDGLLRPTDRGCVPMPWLSTPAALMPMWMFTDDGVPFSGDPRHALRVVLDRYASHNWHPVVGTEMEFYLIDDSADQLRPPVPPRAPKRHMGGEILSLRALDAFDTFFSELYEACDVMAIPVEAAISESGHGQFEVNLSHTTDALRAADDAWLFKLLAHGLARKHGFAASFMAKPYAAHAGNGLHTHFSVLDSHGQNIFDDGGPRGTDLLRHAIAGCLDAMPASTLIFAPHGSSYARFEPGSHAPTGVAWGYDNRTTALRVPASPPSARRIEHRVAGGDTNPYLMLAVVLGAALLGIEAVRAAPDPLTGNAYAYDLAELPNSWTDAVVEFENSSILAQILSPDLIRNFLMTKKQEMQYYPTLTPGERIDLYLETV